jgi:hypothetical protein
MEIAIAIMFAVAAIVIAVRSIYRERQWLTIKEQRAELVRLKKELERHNDKPE